MSTGIQSFLYVLMRDHMPAGVVEAIVREHVERPLSLCRAPQFSNEHLAAYAKELAERIEAEAFGA